MSKKKFAHLTMEERTELARQVKPLRLQQKLTQAELAEYAKTDRTTVSNIERGRAPQAAVLERLLTVLGVETETVEFDPETQRWLVTMGTLIEAIPEGRRSKHVDKAIGALAAGIKDTGNVSAFPTNVGGGSDYEAPEYQAVASSMERGPEEDE